MMKDESKNVGLSKDGGTDTPALPMAGTPARQQAELGKKLSICQLRRSSDATRCDYRPHE